MIGPIVAIGLGGGVGALLRYVLGACLNYIFPTLPLGTLTANLLGGFLMGIMMAITKNHAWISESVRLGIITGFLGGLTTFSTFSAEAVTLLSHHEYIWFAIMVGVHVMGSIIATIFGIYLFT